MSGLPDEAGAGQTRPGAAESGSSAGKSSVFPAVERKSETSGSGRQGGETEAMKCTYCDGLDHLESRCPSRAGDRVKEVIMALIVFIFALPSYILGFLSGIWWSALKTGFSFTKDFWPEAWTTIRGKDDGESGSV